MTTFLFFLFFGVVAMGSTGVAGVGAGTGEGAGAGNSTGFG
jgi:hypothetical protein